METIKKSFQYGPHEVTLETGAVARQADGAVMVNMADTSVLVTVVGRKEAIPGRDFFPLTVNYQERTYAAGKIPGGFFKREGRPSEKETLTSRLIDRPLRPLFPKGFRNEVQVIATVISLNDQVDPDIPALIGASAALAISGIPFDGPLGAARVGYINDDYVLNFPMNQSQESALDLVVAGTKDAVLMVESEAKMLSEEIMLGAVIYGHEQLQVVIEAIHDFAQAAAKPAWDWQPVAENTELLDTVKQTVENGMEQAYQVAVKQDRQESVAALRQQALQLSNDDNGWTEEELRNAFSKVEKNVVRKRVISGEPRIDGRNTTTVRPLDIRVGTVARAHGSAIFTRGETQAMVVATLGTDRDAQLIDALEGERKDRFMFHYNFPPYCVGETGMVGSPKRREIGHGKLAKRGVQAVMPDVDESPYVVRVVSEITESNGSSSMASVCGSSLALMDAGVPLKSPVAGIAMGLVKEGDDFVVLSDILGDEDHLGDMDFKVAGTDTGITALQMDIKINGITREIMSSALAQAKQGRLHILDAMNTALPQSREEVSEFAPRFLTLKIHPDKIRDVIGKGGVTIRSITEQTGAVVDIDDDGTVKISSTDKTAGDAALQMVKDITAEVEVGKVYEGKVAKIMDFGAFVTVLPGKDGLVHISEISHERVESVSSKLSEGEQIKVKVLEIDKQGRVRLSMKALIEKPVKSEED